jgi:hypothetical protein
MSLTLYAMIMCGMITLSVVRICFSILLDTNSERAPKPVGGEKV